MMQRKNPLSKIAGQVTKTSRKKASPQKEEKVDYISTGSVLLNLALAQKGAEGGIARGRVINFVGDKSAGKTLLTLETCHGAYRTLPGVESNLWPTVKNLNIWYNSSEGAIDFPIAQMYGEDFANDIELTHIDTIEKWGRALLKRGMAMDKGDSLIAVLDSIDTTPSAAAKKRAHEAIKKDKEKEGSYNTEVPRYFSEDFFPSLCDIQKEKDITLILVSQVRENMNAGMFGKKFRRNGGKSLDHNCHQILWLYGGKKMKEDYKGHTCVYGVNVRAEVEKNKTAPPFREAKFPILFNYGVDDVRAMISFLNGPERKTIDWRGKTIKVTELMEMVVASDREYRRLVNATEELWFKVENIMEREKALRRRKF